MQARKKVLMNKYKPWAQMRVLRYLGNPNELLVRLIYHDFKDYVTEGTVDYEDFVTEVN